MNREGFIIIYAVIEYASMQILLFLLVSFKRVGRFVSNVFV